MYGPYPMGGRGTRSRGPRGDDPLDRYLRTEFGGVETRDSFLLGNPENGAAKESAVRRLVKVVLLNLRRVKPTPAAAGA